MHLPTPHCLAWHQSQGPASLRTQSSRNLPKQVRQGSAAEDATDTWSVSAVFPTEDWGTYWWYDAPVTKKKRVTPSVSRCCRNTFCTTPTARICRVCVCVCVFREADSTNELARVLFALKKYSTCWQPFGREERKVEEWCWPVFVSAYNTLSVVAGNHLTVASLWLGVRVHSIS